MIRNYTPKQIEKYKRQKYINALTKCTKNLFKLFRSEESSYESYKKRFTLLKKEIDNLDKIRLDSEHSKKVDEYLQELYKRTIEERNYSEKEFQELKSIELTNLNRLQKLKNRKKYSKTKHKNNFF